MNDSNAARSGTSSRTVRTAAAAPAADLETPPERAAPAEVEVAEVETGWLSLDATPWATVSLDGRSLGHTPLMRVEVPAGEHELVLENPERGIRRVYVVRVRPGESVRRRVAF